MNRRSFIVKLKVAVATVALAPSLAFRVDLKLPKAQEWIYEDCGAYAILKRATPVENTGTIDIGEFFRVAHEIRRAREKQ